MIGAVACIPLAFTFPAFFHSCAILRRERAGVVANKMEEGKLGLGSPLLEGQIGEEPSHQGPEGACCGGPLANRAIVGYGMAASAIALVGAVGNWAGFPVRFPVINL